MEAYAKAKAIDPNNPRAVFGEADYQLGGAKWTGVDTKPLCVKLIKLSNFLLLLNRKRLSLQNGDWIEH